MAIRRYIIHNNLFEQTLNNEFTLAQAQVAALANDPYCRSAIRSRIVEYQTVTAMNGLFVSQIPVRAFEVYTEIEE